MTTQAVATTDKPAATGLALITGGGALANADYGNYAGAGFEGVTSADFKPSFLKILQGLSPEIETVPGAKPGLIIDTITKDLFPEAIFIPAAREHVFVAWLPRNEGGGGGQGFGGVFKTTDPMVMKSLAEHMATHGDMFQRSEDGKIILPKHPDGLHELHETIYYHGVQAIAEGAGFFPVSIPFASTGLPVAASWITTQRRNVTSQTGALMPLFAHVWRLGTVKKTKGQQSWYIWSTQYAFGNAKDSALSQESPAFKAGAAVYESFVAGTAKVDYSASSGAAEGGGKSKTIDSEIPF